MSKIRKVCKAIKKPQNPSGKLTSALEAAVFEAGRGDLEALSIDLFAVVFDGNEADALRPTRVVGFAGGFADMVVGGLTGALWSRIKSEDFD